MKKLVLFLALTLPASQALAAFPQGKVGASLSPVVDFSLDGLPEDADGNALGFYGELGGDLIFGYGDFRSSSLDFDSDVDMDIDETRFGLGVRGGNETGFLEARIEQYEIEFDIEGADSAEEDGAGVHVGGGIPLGTRAEAFGRFGILSLDDLDGNEFQLGARGELSTNVEVYGLFRKLVLEDNANDEADLDEIRLGLNLMF